MVYCDEDDDEEEVGDDDRSSGLLRLFLSFTLPTSRMFSGFKSRCTILIEWREDTAESSLLMICAASLS
jgi:hypothetical protein